MPHNQNQLGVFTIYTSDGRYETEVMVRDELNYHQVSDDTFEPTGQVKMRPLFTHLGGMNVCRWIEFSLKGEIIDRDDASIDQAAALEHHRYFIAALCHTLETMLKGWYTDRVQIEDDPDKDLLHCYGKPFGRDDKHGFAKDYAGYDLFPPTASTVIPTASTKNDTPSDP